MHKLWSLTKTLLKTNSIFSTSQYGKRKTYGYIFFVLIMVSILPLMVFLWDLTKNLYDAFAPLHMEEVILVLTMVASFIVIIVFGLFFVMGTLYLSRDLELLLPLPVKSWQILISKLSVVLVYEYLTLIPFVGPVLIHFGLLSQGGVVYWIYLILITLLLPIIPLILITLFVMVIMRFTKFFYNRDRFHMITSILSLIIVLWVSYSFNTAASVEPSALQQLVQEKNGVVHVFKYFLPNIHFAVRALFYYNRLLGVWNLILYFLINGAVLFLFIGLGKLLYLKGAVGSQQISAKRVMLTHSYIDKKSKRFGKVTSYMIQDLRVLFRTPIYFLNCVIFNFIWLIFLIMPLFFSGSSGFTQLIRQISLQIQSPVFLIGFTGTMLLFTATNPIASTAISREGKSIIVSKYIPISYFQQIMGKVLSGFLLNLSGGLILTFFLTYFLKLSIRDVLMLLSILVLIIFSSNMLNIIVDILRPKLYWDNEQQAVKQNINVVIGLFLPFLAGIPVAIMIVTLNLSFIETYLVIMSYYLIMNGLLYYIIKKCVVNWYSKIVV